MTPEQARFDGLGSAFEAIIPALEAFLRYPDEDPAAANLAVWRAALNEPLPTRGVGTEETLRILREVVIPNGSRDGAPGAAAWVTTVATTVPTVANTAATIVAEQRTGLHSGNFLEHLAVEWLKQLLDIPLSYGGILTSGGSMALLLALAAARQAAGEKRGLDASADGIAGLPRPRVYGSSETHKVIARNCGFLGLGRKHMVQLPVDHRTWRIDMTALRAQVRADVTAGCTPVAIVANGGATNTGAVDPIRDMLELAREVGCHLIVDGAYGLFGVLDERARWCFEGYREADSLVVDPHKWLAVSQGCGSVFVRDEKLLQRACHMESPAYTETARKDDEPLRSQHEDKGFEFESKTLEVTSRARGLEV
jgi:aromatic-L-amino-acid decarboxylase